jgi:hypothetical protein
MKRTLRIAFALAYSIVFWTLFGLSAQSEDGNVQTDEDHNGIPDDVEFRLANQFAPVLLYDADEPNLPTSVDRFLGNTELWYFSEFCHPQQVQISKLAGPQLLHFTRPSCRVPGEMIDSQGTRSPGKNSTFYLSTVSGEKRRGGEDSDAWVTYVHAYRNDVGGITIQYWRFYAFNTSYVMGFPIDFGTHGGDWEAIHVVLKPSPTGGFEPVQIRLLGHRDIVTRSWSEALTDAGHPLIGCEKGSHTSMLMSRSDLSMRSRRIEHKCWTGGSVRWPGGKVSSSGPFVMLGQKTSPRSGMEWLRYSGLWGTRENSGLYQFYRSGYWGPAFNETGIRKDGFVSAWCEGIAGARDPRQEKECFADNVVP